MPAFAPQTWVRWQRTSSALKGEVLDREQKLQARLDAHLGRRRRRWAGLLRDPAGLVLQVSDAQLVDELQHLLQPEAPELRCVVLPADPLLQQRNAWVTASVADARAEPSHASEQVTQALLGEALEPLLQRQGWLLARLRDGYVAWLRDWHLRLVPASVPQDFQARCDARVKGPLCTLREAPDGAAIGEAVLGTWVQQGEGRAGWRRVEWPGRAGWLRDTDLTTGDGDWPPDAGAILSTLRLFGGVPYVWGGKSPKGFDCSGLVQFVFGLHGVELPRDSDEQFECGQPVEEVVPGDLLFFGRDQISHVAVALDGQQFVHARGEVRCNALQPHHPLYDAELARIYRGARRVLPQTVLVQRSG